jgi:hypothetical protein
MVSVNSVIRYSKVQIVRSAKISKQSNIPGADLLQETVSGNNLFDAKALGIRYCWDSEIGKLRFLAATVSGSQKGAVN